MDVMRGGRMYIVLQKALEGKDVVVSMRNGQAYVDARNKFLNICAQRKVQVQDGGSDFLVGMGTVKFILHEQSTEGMQADAIYLDDGADPEWKQQIITRVKPGGSIYA